MSVFYKENIQFYRAMLIILVMGFFTSSFALEGFQEVAQERHEAFKKEMTAEIEKQTAEYRGKVKTIYEAIGYHPVWVDRDYLTHHTELLIAELKEDFKKGLHQDLVAEYKKLLPDSNQLFHSDSIEDKARVEIGIMKLYVKVINNILKAHNSKHTPLTIIQKALAEQDLMSAISDIDKERIMHEISSVDMNLTELKAERKAYQKLTKRLLGKDKKERLKAMYELLDYQPIWITEEGPTPFASALYEHIENDITLDRNSSVYLQYQKLKRMPIPQDKNAMGVREFEIAKLYQDYMSHVLYGDINWKKFQAKMRRTMKHGVWEVHKILATPESLLLKAVQAGDLQVAFDHAKPDAAMYEKMLKGLKKYQDIVASGGWEPLPKFKSLKPGQRSSVVPALRERLKKEGDYVSCGEKAGIHYDKCLVEAVKKFQLRHGLEAKGYVGKQTQKALAMSAEEKVEKIKLNLDRIKWLKRGKERYHIFVNIPSFMMYMFDGNDVMAKMRVIAGRKGHESPIFYGRIRTIVLNPYWRIPPSIVRHETIPKLQKDPGYTKKKKIEIHKGYSEHSPEINPYKVNWHKYGKKLPPYKFMQSPGEHNALGKVKYLFPNKYSVYMHDTNQRYLFSKDFRALSHGCVRLQKPFDLFEAFSKIEPNIDYEKSQKILAENKKTPYRLSDTIPVDIIYLTSFVDGEGNVMFYDDVYGYDAMQMEVSRN